MPVALNDFVKNLEDSGIVSPSKLQHFLPPKAAPKDAQELAKQLVRSKTLTRYQAQEVYLGRARGLILGSYTILDKIGAGGMGQVFKAQHRRMDRLVAIKVLPAAMTKDAAAVARFEREVRAAAKLEHPNIVTAHDSDESNGVHFLVMQLVEGSDLAALVKKSGPLGVEKAVDYVLQAARGLEYAHEQGVIHRDIKPANLLVDAKGTVKILDMGLARLENNVGGDAATAAELTASGTIMGTVDYMAPEQALNTKHADAKSDIYGLGCTLHYLLVGKAPYDGETLMEKLLAHREQPIPDLGAAGIVPAELQTIFEQMIAKQPADRYPSMGDTARALAEYRAQLSEPSIVRPAATTSSGPASALTFLRDVSLAPRRSPARSSQTKAGAVKKADKTNADQPGSGGRRWRIAALAGGLLMLGLGAVAGWRAWNVPGADQIAGSQPATKKPSAASLDLLNPAKIPATERFDWQPKELVAVLGQRRGAHGNSWNAGQPLGQIAFSPDGSRLSSHSSAVKGVMLWDAKTLLPLHAFSEPAGTLDTLAYAPDGKTLAVQHVGQTKLWDLSGVKPVLERTLPQSTNTLAYSSHGDRMATSWGNEIKLWTVNKLEPALDATWTLPHDLHVWGMLFLEDGKSLVVRSEQSRLTLWNITSPEPSLICERVSHPGTDSVELAAASDGRVLATGGGDSTVRLWQVTDHGIEERHALQTSGAVSSVSFAPDGASLAAGCLNGSVRLWDLYSDKPRKRAEFTTDKGYALATFSPDSKTLATFGQEHIVRLWDISVPDPTELFPPEGHRGWVSSIAFSPDGKRLASGGVDKTVRLWDLSGDEPKQEPPLIGHTLEVRVVRFSPDGKTLISAQDNQTLSWDLRQRDPEGQVVLTSTQSPHDAHFDSTNRLSMATGWGNGQLELWEVNGVDSTKREMPSGFFGVFTAAISPDGKLAAYSTGQGTALMDLAAPAVTELARLDGSGAALAFSTDGRKLAGRGPKGITVWDVTKAGAPELATFKVPPDWFFTAITFARDGQYLFAADIFGHVLCWDVASGKRIANREKAAGTDSVLWQLPGAVRKLVASPDGRYLASANSDGSVYILRLDALLAATGPSEK